MKCEVRGARCFPLWISISSRAFKPSDESKETPATGAADDAAKSMLEISQSDGGGRIS